ncbi:MAG: HPr family phosphocarrier protein [Clostridia bacterium]|jgi:phosphocarrier protein HPr|nr:HPr family phosphocarrier protein [Clostridia bacterium]
MIIRQLKIVNEAGLHARPAAMFVNLASKFKSSILVEKGDDVYNAKSLISILSSKIVKGDIINLIIEGEDEELAEKALTSLIENML